MSGYSLLGGCRATDPITSSPKHRDLASPPGYGVEAAACRYSLCASAHGCAGRASSSLPCEAHIGQLVTEMQEAGGILKADRKREQMKMSCEYRRSGEQEPEVPEEGLG